MKFAIGVEPPGLDEGPFPFIVQILSEDKIAGSYYITDYKTIYPKGKKFDLLMRPSTTLEKGDEYFLIQKIFEYF